MRPYPGAHPVFEKLSPAAIMSAGRWKRILTVLADGWLARIARAREPGTYAMLWTRDWVSDPVVCNGSVSYVAGAMVRLGRWAPDSWLGENYRQVWLPHVLQSQDPDGYIGTGHGRGCFQWGGSITDRRSASVSLYELLCQDLVLESLLWEHAYSGDQAVLQAAKRAGAYVVRNYLSCDQLPTELKTGHRIAIFRSLVDLYRYTGDDLILQRLTHHFRESKAELSSLLSSNRIKHHLVDLCYSLQALVMMYLASGERELLEMAEKAVESISCYALQVTGTPTGYESTMAKGPRKATEHCGVIEWAKTCMALLRVTGKIYYADVAERCMWNAYLGSKSPDGLLVAYFHAPNQLFATNWSGEYNNDFEPSGTFRGFYSMNTWPICCNAMTSKGFPQLIENAVVHTQDSGFAFVFYGPYTFTAALPASGTLSIEQTTDYPFQDEVEFAIRLDGPAEFPLYFRIPGWCRSAKLWINGSEAGTPVLPGRFARVQRTWTSGDLVRIAFDFPTEVAWHIEHQSVPGVAIERHAVPGAAVVRGPLVFCLPIEPSRERFAPGGGWTLVPGGGAEGNLTLDETWNVVPVGDALWNVALDLDVDDPERSLQRVSWSVPQGSMPWERAPVGLKAKARRLPDWQMDRINGQPNTPALPDRLSPEGEPIEVTLVPFGFTSIRLTFLPVLGVSKPSDIP